MFIAMNRFRVKRGAEEAFEKVWLSRDSYLDRVPGFVEFHLLKGPEALQIGRSHAMKATGANAPMGQIYCKEFSIWIEQHGFKRMAKSVRSRSYRTCRARNRNYRVAQHFARAPAQPIKTCTIECEGLARGYSTEG